MLIPTSHNFAVFLTDCPPLSNLITFAYSCCFFSLDLTEPTLRPITPLFSRYLLKPLCKRNFILSLSNSAQVPRTLIKIVKNGFLLPSALNEDYIIIFLNCIDGYTISHFHLLRYFNNPKAYYASSKEYFTTSPMSLYNNTYPRSTREYRLLDIIAKQLYNDGFLNTGDLHTNTTMSGALAQRTTDMGRKFIEFFGLNDVEL